MRNHKAVDNDDIAANLNKTDEVVTPKRMRLLAEYSRQSKSTQSTALRYHHLMTERERSKRLNPLTKSLICHL